MYSLADAVSAARLQEIIAETNERFGIDLDEGEVKGASTTRR